MVIHMSTPSYRWAFVAPSDALKCVADPALVTYTNIIDALKHATSSFVIVAYGNRVVAAADADDLLREFACNVALRQMHERGAPDVVKEYLTTRNPDLREAAWYAAWAAARDAAWYAAWAAAWDDTQDAQDAARDAALLAARVAAFDVTWVARSANIATGDQLEPFLLEHLGLPARDTA